MHDATAIILAGGKSRRMGQNKSLLPYNGQPMIEHIYSQLEKEFKHVLIGANDEMDYFFLNAKIVNDEKENCGPLMGIMSAISQSESDLNFITACDIPEMDMAFIHQMFLMADGHDIVMPITGDQRYETLFAIYRKSIIPVARKILNSGKRRIIELFSELDVKFIEMPANTWYSNVNTPFDYKKLTQ